MANRLAQAPNTFPACLTPGGNISLAPKPRVALAYDPGAIKQFHDHFLMVGPPDAKMCYRVIEPGDYHLKTSVSNWVEAGKPHFEFDFRTSGKIKTNQWTSAPKGTVVLLHGYGLAEFSMVPWAVLLAQEGWRCVLVDLRGHGKSTGSKIYYGLVETGDLSLLLDRLQEEHRLAWPVAAVGESYGASLALRWKTTEPRLGPVVAIAPYGVLSNAVMNIAKDYAGWVPKFLMRSGVRQLPAVVGAGPGELDINTVLKKTPIPALFVAGDADKVMKPAEVAELCRLAGNGSRLILVPGATHESLTYFFDDIAPPLLDWLDPKKAARTGATADAMLPSALDTTRHDREN